MSPFRNRYAVWVIGGAGALAGAALVWVVMGMIGEEPAAVPMKKEPLAEVAQVKVKPAPTLAATATPAMERPVATVAAEKLEAPSARARTGPAPTPDENQRQIIAGSEGAGATHGGVTNPAGPTPAPEETTATLTQGDEWIRESGTEEQKLAMQTRGFESARIRGEPVARVQRNLVVNTTYSSVRNRYSGAHVSLRTEEAAEKKSQVFLEIHYLYAKGVFVPFEFQAEFWVHDARDAEGGHTQAIHLPLQNMTSNLFSLAEMVKSQAHP